MGGFGQVVQMLAVQQLDTVLPGLGTGINLKLAANNQAQAQNETLAQHYAAAAHRDALLRSEYDAQERKRKELLRQTLASGNAYFGASGGVGSSSAAVLEGFAAESAQRGTEATSRLGLGLSDLARESSARYRRNLLAADTANDALIPQGVSHALSMTRRVDD